jgi:pilus assembly protein Flp/PilA
MKRSLKQFLTDESAATAIEYALISGLVFLACVGAFTYYGDRMGLMYANLTTALSKVL